MALEELGLSGLENAGGLGSTGLGDFNLPGNIISDAPAPTPDMSGLDFASLSGEAAGALGGGFSDAGGGFDVASLGPVGGGAGLSTGGGGAGDLTDIGGVGDLAIEPPAGQEQQLTQDLSADATKPQPAAAPAPGKDSGMSPLAKTALAASPALGMAAYNIAKGPYVPPAATQLNAQGNVQSALGQQFMQMYQGGQIPGGAAIKLAQDYTGAVSKINQYYANAGQYDSTQRIKAINDAKAKMMAQYATYLDQELKASLSSSGQAGQFFAAAANLQLAADQAFQKSITDLMAGVGKVAAIYLMGAKPTVQI